MSLPSLNELPVLPPVYTLIRLLPGDPALETALKAAAEAEPATIFWEDREDRLDFAVVLAPDRSLTQSMPACLALSVAVVEALGVLAPPQIGVMHRWPDRIMVNGALAGGIGLYGPVGADAEDEPAWLVAHLRLDFRRDDMTAEPGEERERTCLAEEGMVDVGPAPVLEAVTRHFLLATHRWQSGSFKPVAGDWLDRAEGREAPVGFPLADSGEIEAKLLGLADDGAAILSPSAGGKPVTLSLLDHLGRPSWRHILGD